MRRPRPLPAPLTDRAFTTTDAARHGVSRSRLRASDLSHPHRGVIAPIDAGDVHSRASAYAVLLHDGQFFSHATPASLHCLPVPNRLRSGPMHVASLAPARAPRALGITGHQLDGAHWEIVVVDGLPTVTAVDAWCQLATRLTEAELVIVGDALLSRKHPLATRKQLVRGLARMNGRRGAKKLRRAYERVREDTDSPKETELRLAIVDAGLPEPIVNAPIFDALGRFVALGDLVYTAQMVLVEYDGETHFTDEAAVIHDIDRLESVVAAGWRVIRVNRSHSLDPDGTVITAIREALSSRTGSRGGKKGCQTSHE